MSEFGEPWTLFCGIVGTRFDVEIPDADIQRRAVSCVNALASTPDPAAFVKAARKAERVLHLVRDALEADEWDEHVDDQAHTVAELVAGEVREALAALRAAKGED